jgi:pSer/pThr/pTyr-binding forkhead associated (FHA) protein
MRGGILCATRDVATVLVPFATNGSLTKGEIDMEAAVKLTITRGPLKGRHLVFDKPSAISVGRAGDCDMFIPSHDDYMDVSRHHGWFQIDPPCARVFDSGSLNGTYVNGVNISKVSEPSWTGDLSVDMGDLHDGDEVRMGNLVFEVGIVDPDASVGVRQGADSAERRLCSLQQV